MISTAQDMVTTCPKCGYNTFAFHMTANSVGTTTGYCPRCHYQATVKYQNNSFGTKINSIG